MIWSDFPDQTIPLPNPSLVPVMSLFKSTRPKRPALLSALALALLLGKSHGSDPLVEIAQMSLPEPITISALN